MDYCLIFCIGLCLVALSFLLRNHTQLHQDHNRLLERVRRLERERKRDVIARMLFNKLQGKGEQ